MSIFNGIVQRHNMITGITRFYLIWILSDLFFKLIISDTEKKVLFLYRLKRRHIGITFVDGVGVWISLYRA